MMEILLLVNLQLEKVILLFSKLQSLTPCYVSVYYFWGNKLVIFSGKSIIIFISLFGMPFMAEDTCSNCNHYCND